MCSKNEVFISRQFGVETSSLPYWKEREKGILLEHKHWYLDFGLPVLTFPLSSLFLPWYLSIDWYLIKNKENMDNQRGLQTSVSYAKVWVL